jgi:hypothetical protein
VTSTRALLRKLRFRPGHHRLTITRADVLDADEFNDLTVRELIDESFRAQHAGDAKRGHVLALAAAARYQRALKIARKS